jgi:hypothetical protein
MSPPGSSQSADHDHDHDEDHDHADEGGHGDEGPMLDLGSAKAGEWTVTASRIEGELNPGGETAIDCSVSGTSGSVSAVRCWIGTKDASGSIKSLAEVEDAAEPAHRHAHVEVPKPLEDGSQLWVEIEDSSGSKHVAGFDLKR